MAAAVWRRVAFLVLPLILPCAVCVPQAAAQGCTFATVNVGVTTHLGATADGRTSAPFSISVNRTDGAGTGAASVDAAQGRLTVSSQAVADGVVVSNATVFDCITVSGPAAGSQVSVTLRFG